MNPVPDIIDTNLRILFIGFNPGIRSAETGHHFAGPSNRFWRLLYEAGLTPRKLLADEDRQLLMYGYGITNIVPRPTRTAAEITTAEYESGREVLRKKLIAVRPRTACYVGIEVYRRFSKLRDIKSGLQTGSVIPGITDFVVSSSSGLNRIPFEQQLAYYIALKELLEK